MGRSPCCEKQDTNKGAWTKEEDQRLIDYIRSHGEGCWRSLPKAAGLLRCGKSCRLRWINYLRPDLKRGNFTDDEDQLIVKLHSLLGNKWSVIAGRLPGRTDNEIKNYWNTHIKRKLISRGIDPQTHRPVNDATPSPSVKMKTEFTEPEEANCATSGTTSDEELQPNHYVQDKKDDEKSFLELSLGPTPDRRFKDSVLAEPGGWGVKTETALCLCCRLRLQRTEPCGDCQATDGSFRC